MKLGVDVFTTGQVAKRQGVAPRTVSKWTDSGKLKSYRLRMDATGAHAGDRRIPREGLIEFLKQRGMPLGDLETGHLNSVLLVAVDLQTAAKLKTALPLEDGYRHTSAETLFEAGTRIPEFKPNTIVIDLVMGRTDCLLMVQHLRRQEAHKDTRIIALAGEDETNPDYLTVAGCTDVFKQPVDARKLAVRIAEAKQPA